MSTRTRSQAAADIEAVRQWALRADLPATLLSIRPSPV